jgi:hypothetical protein
MWEIFAGIALWAILYPMTQEWLQRRTDKKRLADMRKHFSMRHRWDALKGRWIDEWMPSDLDDMYLLLRTAAANEPSKTRTYAKLLYIELASFKSSAVVEASGSI